MHGNVLFLLPLHSGKDHFLSKCLHSLSWLKAPRNH